MNRCWKFREMLMPVKVHHSEIYCWESKLHNYNLVWYKYDMTFPWISDIYTCTIKGLHSEVLFCSWGSGAGWRPAGCTLWKHHQACFQPAALAGGRWWWRWQQCWRPRTTKVLLRMFEHVYRAYTFFIYL